MASLNYPSIFRCVTRISFQKQGEIIPGEQIHELLNELDTNRNGQVELDEYLQVGQIGFFCLSVFNVQIFAYFCVVCLILLHVVCLDVIN